jgi:hypothetical protein
MAALMEDDVVDRFAVRGHPKTIGAEVAGRFGEVTGRVGAYLPYQANIDLLAELASSFA